MKKVTALGLCLIMILFSGCRKKNENEVVITQAFENLLYLGLYVAQDGGFFADEGLSVRIETAGGDAQAFSALTGRSCDFAQADPSFIAIGNQRGWRGKVIASVVNRAAIFGVSLDTTISPISSMLQMQGKSIAVFPYPNTSYVIQKQLSEAAGLRINKDIKLVEVNLGTELVALRRGEAVIAQTLEPTVSEVESQGGRMVVSYPDFYGPIAFSGLMVSQKTINRHPDMVRRVIRAYNRALEYVHEDIDGATKIAIARFPDNDPTIVASAVRRLVESNCIPASTEVTEEAWGKLLQIRLEVGDITSLPKNQLYDNQFLEDYLKRKNATL